MVELRKRKAPAEPVPPPASKKASNPVKKAVEKAKEVIGGKPAASTKSDEKLAVGSTITLEGFGGEVETHGGEKTNLKKLLEASKAGVVLFTYPKASTPGCTTQACLFRDNYSPLTAAGLSVYGLSSDSPKSNTTFATKQSLPYTLLCDPSRTLISAIGMKKSPPGTTRGVVVIDKTGKLTAWEQAGPQRTVDVVMAALPKGDQAPVEATKDKAAVPATSEQSNGASAKEAEVAAEVADTAEKLDSNTEIGPKA